MSLNNEVPLYFDNKDIQSELSTVGKRMEDRGAYINFNVLAIPGADSSSKKSSRGMGNYVYTKQDLSADLLSANRYDEEVISVSMSNISQKDNVPKNLNNSQVKNSSNSSNIHENVPTIVLNSHQNDRGERLYNSNNRNSPSPRQAKEEELGIIPEESTIIYNPTNAAKTKGQKKMSMQNPTAENLMFNKNPIDKSHTGVNENIIKLNSMSNDFNVGAASLIEEKSSEMKSKKSSSRSSKSNKAQSALNRVISRKFEAKGIVPIAPPPKKSLINIPNSISSFTDPSVNPEEILQNALRRKV